MSHSNGGRPHNEFVFEHYNKMGVRNPKTKHWQVECHYCPDKKIIEHRDMNCLQHLANPQLCPNAPADVRKEARRLIMVKGGIETIVVSDGEEDTSGPVVQKNAKGSKGQVVATRTVEAFLDRAMSTEEVDKANIHMLRLGKYNTDMGF